MNPRLFDELTLICPSCRSQGERSVLRLRPLQVDTQGFVLEGLLDCAAGCRYPILDGVPVVLRDMAEWWCQSRAGLSRAAVADPALVDYFTRLDAADPDRHARQGLLSTYLDAHYGDPTSPEGWPRAEAYWQRVVATAESTATGGCALDLGCGVGRLAFELARFHHQVVGLDLNFHMVAAAARIQRSGRIEYQRRLRGRQFTEIRQPYDASRNVLFLVADALDPPFDAASFDTVAALNLLDNVSVPLTLIGQMDALLRRAGTLLIGSPYEWRHDISDPSQWLEDADRDAPSVLRAILVERLIEALPLDYRIIEEITDLPWILRQHHRFWQRFSVHLLAARKG